MTDFFELTKIRQSCRSFSDAPVDHAELMRIVEAGRNAPSACCSQPWSFVVVESNQLVREIAKCGQQLDINAFLDGATAFIVVLEEHAVLMKKLRTIIDSQYFAKCDIGQAVAYMCLQAAELGLGTCQIGIYDRSRMAELLGLPPEKPIAALIAVGTPASPDIREKKRKSMDELVRFV